MTDFESALQSPDRQVRLAALTDVSPADLPPEDKKDLLFIVLKGDPHDSVRSKAVELLLSLFPKDREVHEVLFTHLKKEPFWAVRFRILRTLQELGIDFHPYKSQLVTASFDVKPQVRITCAELLLPLSNDDEDVATRLVQLVKDRDESVRTRVEQLLVHSSNPQLKELMEEYERKLAEKEKKRKEIAGMFDGI